METTTWAPWAAISRTIRMAAFRDTFLRVLVRQDVVAAYAQIAELDPGEESGRLQTQSLS